MPKNHFIKINHKNLYVEIMENFVVKEESILKIEKKKEKRERKSPSSFSQKQKKHMFFVP